MINDAQSAEAGAKKVAQNNEAVSGKPEKIVFNKPHLEPLELIAKLRKQGMAIDSRSALPYLEQVGGYRMKGYWYQWLDQEEKVFRHHASFDQVIERYEFDRELRKITSDALERIELMVRAAISNVMSKHEGPHWFTKPELFKPVGRPAAEGDQENRKQVKKPLLDRVADEVEWMARKPFIEHYRSKYCEPSLPPSWAISECLSFGSWSIAYPTLANSQYRKEICRRFRVEEPDVFRSWIHALSVMRNTVAHHGRLLGTMTSVTPREYRSWGLEFATDQSRTFFVTATVINFLCQSIKRGPEWKPELGVLFAKYPGIPIQQGLGFPEGWGNAPGWKPNDGKPVRHKRMKKAPLVQPSAMGIALKVALAVADGAPTTPVKASKRGSP